MNLLLPRDRSCQLIHAKDTIWLQMVSRLGNSGPSANFEYHSSVSEKIKKIKTKIKIENKTL